MTLTLLPDAERLALAYLRSHPEVTALVEDRIYGALPARPLWPAVRMVRWGGAPVIDDPLWLDQATCQVDVWGGSKAETARIAQTIRAALAAPWQVPDAVVSRVSFGPYADDPDTTFDPAKPRIRFDVSFTVHPLVERPERPEPPEPEPLPSPESVVPHAFLDIDTPVGLAIGGTDLAGVTAVELVAGGARYVCTDLVVVSDTQLTCTTPELAEGTYDLEAISAAGVGVLVDAIDVEAYVPPPVAVPETVTPGSVLTTETPVPLLIGGRNLGRVSGVTLSTQLGADWPCTNVVVIDEESITATTPELPEGHYWLSLTSSDASLPLFGALVVEGPEMPPPWSPLELDWAACWWGDGERWQDAYGAAEGPMPSWPDETAHGRDFVTGPAPIRVPSIAHEPASSRHVSTPGNPQGLTADLSGANAIDTSAGFALAVVVGLTPAATAVDIQTGESPTNVVATTLRRGGAGNLNLQQYRTNQANVTLTGGTPDPGWHLILCDFERASGRVRILLDGLVTEDVWTPTGNIDLDWSRFHLGASTAANRVNNGFNGYVAFCALMGRPFDNAEAQLLTVWADEHYHDLPIPAQDPIFPFDPDAPDHTMDPDAPGQRGGQ